MDQMIADLPLSINPLSLSWLPQPIRKPQTSLQILQMELPIGNFFEVTINSNKLYSFMEQIMRKMETQQVKVSELQKLITTINRGIDDRLVNYESGLGIEMEKLKKLNQQESNYFKLYLKDVDKKLSEKMVEVEANVGQLSKKLNLTKEAIEQDISIKLSYLEKKIQNITVIEELQSKINSQLSKLALSISKIEEINKQSQDNYESHFKKHTEISENLMERLNNNEMQKKMENENFASMATSFREVDSSKSKRKNRSNRHDTFFQQLQGLSDSVEVKIEDLQSKMKDQQTESKPKQRRSIISNNKIVKYHDNISKVPPKSGFSHKNQNRLKEIESHLIEKLNRIEELSINKVALLEREIYKQTNKSEIIDEHIGILSRKLEKEKFRINEISDAVRITNDKRVDEKVIENLKAMIKKMSKDFEEALQLKMQRDIYEKDRAKINEKIQPLIDVITEKADKAEVRKGLSFLQEKLKEIIIVVAEQKATNQDGAIKKTPFKCLSCDKDLEQKQEMNNRLNKQNSSSNIRGNTTQMRKRIRMINNTVSTVNGDD